MVDNPDYSVGTVSITTGTKALTGVGTMWMSADLEKGDEFGFDGYATSRIDTITADGTITLLDTWRGPTLSSSPYFIRYQADGSGLTGQSIALRRMLSQPLLTAFAGLAAAADKLMYFTGANTMALADFKSWARSLFGLTMAADKFPYGVGPNTMGLADLTAYARTLLDDANAGAAQTTLGMSAFFKTLLSAADAGAFTNTIGFSQGGAGANRWYKIPMGTNPVSLMIQCGSQVVTTSAAGAAVLTHPTPFFSDTSYGVVAWAGDDGNVHHSNIRNATPFPSATQFATRARTANTGAIVASTLIRVDWIAVGAAA